MAFSSTVIGEMSIGNRKMVWGTYTNTSGVTGGDITTGLLTIESMVLQPHSTTAAVVAEQPVIDETFPICKDGVTIVTTDTETGWWRAIGF